MSAPLSSRGGLTRRLLTGLLLLPGAVLAQGRPTTVATAPNVGGFGAPQTVTSFSPVYNDDSNTDMQAYSILYTPLIWPSPVITVDWKLGLAESVHYNRQRTVVTVKLKPRRWTDGTPVTAADVVYTWKLIEQQGRSYGLYGVGGMPYVIRQAQAISADTVRFTLKHPVSEHWFTLNALSQLYPLPAKAWGQHSNTYFRNHETDMQLMRVSDGPYRLDRFVPGRYARFSVNPYYPGKLPVRHFELRFFTDWTTQFSALKTGELQIGEIPTPLYSARRLVAHLPSYANAPGKAGFYPYEFRMIRLNFRNPKIAFMRDETVRQALQMTIPQQAIIDVVFHGLGAASFTAVPPVPDTYLSPSMKALDEHPNREYDPAKAARLLDQDGWKVHDGVRAKDGKRLEFTLLYLTGSRAQTEEADMLKASWQKLGVMVHLKRMPQATLLATVRSGKSEAAMLLWAYAPNMYPSGDGLFNASGVLASGFHDAALDTAINASIQPHGREALWHYEALLAKQLPVLFLPVPGYQVRHDACLSGMRDYLNPAAYIAPQALRWKTSGSCMQHS
ncbi:peptide ABC transporter substrate-binding protein [Acidihalobacter aeolianus]|nr:peptide ABC transporter substrate-binding protein [Acidihalobacter aeolianus]